MKLINETRKSDLTHCLVAHRNRCCSPQWKTIIKKLTILKFKLPQISRWIIRKPKHERDSQMEKRC